MQLTTLGLFVLGGEKRAPLGAAAPHPTVDVGKHPSYTSISPLTIKIVLQPSPRSVFLDCLNIFAVVTFTFTLQPHVSVFYSVSRLCLSP